jgi:hypothetical protein
MPHAADDLASADEVKVYKDEGDEENRASENLSEDKIGLVTETEEVSVVSSCVDFSCAVGGPLEGHASVRWTFKYQAPFLKSDVPLDFVATIFSMSTV